MYGWKNYDFCDPECWQIFCNIWNSEEVQAELDMWMTHWCIHEKHGFIWKRGDPIWKFSRTRYWQKQISALAEKEVDTIPDPFEMYRKLMKNKGFPVFAKNWEEIEYTDLGNELYFMWNNKVEEIEKKYEPEPNSLESIMLIKGKNYLSWVFKKVANILFPNCTVFILNVDRAKQNNRVFIKEMKLMFDPYDSFFSTRFGDTPFLETDKGKRFIETYFPPN